MKMLFIYLPLTVSDGAQASHMWGKIYTTEHYPQLFFPEGLFHTLKAPV